MTLPATPRTSPTSAGRRRCGGGPDRRGLRPDGAPPAAAQRCAGRQPTGGGPLIIGGAALVSAAMLGHLVAITCRSSIGMRLLLGLAEAFLFVAAFTAVATLRPRSGVARRSTTTALSLYVGIAIGPAIGEPFSTSTDFNAVWITRRRCRARRVSRLRYRRRSRPPSTRPRAPEPASTAPPACCHRSWTSSWVGPGDGADSSPCRRPPRATSVWMARPAVPAHVGIVILAPRLSVPWLPDRTGATPHRGLRPDGRPPPASSHGFWTAPGADSRDPHHGALGVRRTTHGTVPADHPA